MAVALADFGLPVGGACVAAFGEIAGIGSEAHGAAKLVDPFQLAQLIDDAVGGGWIELGGVGVGEAAYVTREFDDQSLHAEADAEVGDLGFARVADGHQHSFDAALAESAGDENAVEGIELGHALRPFQTLGFDPRYVNPAIVGQATVEQGFLEALVGVLIFDVLAYEADGNLARRVLHAAHHFAPASEIAGRRVERQQTQCDIVDALLGKYQRTFVDAFDIARGDDGEGIDVAEERDLLLHVGRQGAFTAAQQNVGLNTNGSQVLDAVLGGLGLQFLGGGDPRDQGYMNE